MRLKPVFFHVVIYGRNNIRTIQPFSLLCKFVSTNTDRTNAIAQETNGITLETKMKALIRDYGC